MPTAGRQDENGPLTAPLGPERAVAVLRCLLDALARGDAATAAACFARDGALQTPDATVIHGREEIGRTLRQMAEMPYAFAAELHALTLSADVALGRGLWRMRSLDPAVELEQSTCLSIVFARREAVWKIALALPWEEGPGRGSSPPSRG